MKAFFFLEDVERTLLELVNKEPNSVLIGAKYFLWRLQGLTNQTKVVMQMRF